MPSTHEHARDLIREAGYAVARIVRVLSPGDAAASFEEVLYVTPDKTVARAYIRGRTKPIVWSYPNWSLPGNFEEPPA